MFRVLGYKDLKGDTLGHDPDPLGRSWFGGIAPYFGASVCGTCLTFCWVWALQPPGLSLGLGWGQWGFFDRFGAVVRV